MDDNHGLIASRAHATIEAEEYFWSLHGPRVTTGGASTDLALPLDLGGPSPDALAEVSDRDYAFAYFDPAEREVVFVFGQWAYVLHLRDGNRRWSYRPFGVTLACAGMIYTGDGITLELAALPEILGISSLAPSYVITPGDDPITGPGVSPALSIDWTANGGALGGTEQVEVWIKSAWTGGWARRAVFPAADEHGIVHVRHFETSHTVALRYTIGGVPQASHSAADPGAWPALSRMVKVTQVVVASIEPRLWVRTSATKHGHLLTYRGPGFGRTPEGNEEITFDLQYSIDGKVTWSPAPSPYIPDDYHADLDALTTQFANALLGEEVYYRVRQIGPAYTTPWVESATSLVLGPHAPNGLTVGARGSPGGGHDSHLVNWTDDEVVADATVEFYGWHAVGGADSAHATHTGPTSALGPFLDIPDPSGVGYTPHVKARTVRTAFGLVEYSDWVEAVGAAE
jgi:hypothetical protein